MSGRPTFTESEPLIYVHMRGVPRKQDSGLPIMPNDGDLYGDLLDACRAGAIPYYERMMSGGGGQFQALWLASDWPKVKAWLETRADLVEEHPKKA